VKKKKQVRKKGGKRKMLSWTNPNLKKKNTNLLLITLTMLFVNTLIGYKKFKNKREKVSNRRFSVWWELRDGFQTGYHPGWSSVVFKMRTDLKTLTGSQPFFWYPTYIGLYPALDSRIFLGKSAKFRYHKIKRKSPLRNTWNGTWIEIWILTFGEEDVCM